MGDYKITIEDLISLLNTQWDSLVLELVPGVKQYQGYFTVGDLDGSSGNSLVLYRGPKAGSWRDYATEDSGDALILIEKQVTGGDRGRAISWAKQWLCIDDEDQVTFNARKKTARQKKKKNDQMVKDQVIKTRAQAKAIFLAAKPNIADTSAAWYLFGRGLQIGKHYPKIHALRFEENCYESETKGKHPAIVASISVPEDGSLKMSIHRTYLRIAKNDQVEKLDVKNAKKVLGDYRGGYIPLWRGASGKILYKAVPQEWVVITEGIEDGLSVVMADPSYRVLCAVSLANMAAIILPENIKNVILVKDNDWDNPKALAAFERAIAWHHQNGRRVKILKTPRKSGHDLNDWISGNKRNNCGNK